jgi:hypothetical protein
MDLGAFLAQGYYPLFFLDDTEKKEPWGHVLKRSKRPISWIASNPLPESFTVVFTLDVPGFGLGPGGGLYPSQSLAAALILKGTVRACRSLASQRTYVLKLANLMRILD